MFFLSIKIVTNKFRIPIVISFFALSRLLSLLRLTTLSIFLFFLSSAFVLPI